MSKKEHIVFFTPTLNRTGSEIVLLELLKHVQLNCDITVITKFKGQLYDQIPNGIAKDFLYGQQYGGWFSKIYNKIRKLFFVDQILKKHINAIWYINTIALPDILEFAEMHKIKVIVHLHELQQMYSMLNEQQIARLANYPTLIIANSLASSSVLKEFGSKQTMEVVHPALNQELAQKTKFIDKRMTLNFPKDLFIWVMCGTLDKNKDPFLFIEIALELKKMTSQFKMVWIGGKVDHSTIDIECEQLLEKHQLKDHVQFLGDVKEEFYDYFAMANGFVLTSQFESFSMTTLETLFLQLPIVANDCVGVNEVIGKDLGYVVKEKNNAKEFAERMFQVMNNTVPFDKNALRDRAMMFDIGVISSKWNDILKQRIC